MGAYGSKQLLADLEKLSRNDPTVVSLNYEHSQLGDEGAKVLAKALSSNHVLRRLRLGDCNLTAAGLQTICRSLCQNRIVPANIRKLELVRYCIHNQQSYNYYKIEYIGLHQPRPLFV